MTDRVIITGPSGGAPNRLEINTFVQNDKFFSLYVQALQQVYSTPENLDESFFQIAGIHGLPYTPWNGAVGDEPFDPNAQWGGYCVHGSVLFPTWHRPYLMLFEQVVQQKAKAIAATYTVDTAQWVAAAENLRQPYWDWALNSVPPAAVISLENVTITAPNGRRQSVPNPFFKYTFQTIPRSFPSPYNRWNQTYRQPTGTINNPQTNVTRLTNALRSSQTNIRTNTFTMLTRVRTWTAFSNHTVGDGGSGTSSIEAIHDNIHVLVGGNGQMSDPSVAAFDPIFWLHHCNVDRMTSLWAALHPGVWVSRGDSENGTFTMGAEVPVDQTTPLTPFWNSYSSFWASAGTEDTGRLGYTYPEFNGLDMGNPVAVRTAITAIVNRLYSGRVSVPRPPIFAEMQTGFAAKAAAAPEAEAAAPVVSAFAAVAPAAVEAEAPAPVEAERSRSVAVHPGGGSVPAPPHPVDHGRNSGLWDWTARVEFKKYELNCSFSVLLFLGPVPEDPEEWLVSPNFVGMHSAFVNSAAGHCANCRNNAGVVEEGFIHLDEGIIRHAQIENLDPDVVVPYLKDNLSWRVQKADGTVAELNTLEVKVFAIELTYPPGADFPVPGRTHHHNHITHGKAGGSREA